MAENVVASMAGKTVQGVGSQFVNWGIPIAAGVGGFFMGDIWGAQAIVETWLGPVLDAGNIPFEGRLNYRAFATAAIYGIGAGVIGGLMFKFLPSGGLMRVVAKTIAFYLGGTTARLILAGFLPVSVGTGGAIALPAAVR